MSEQEFPSLGSLSLQPIEVLEHPLMLKDRWHGEKDLGMRINKHLRGSTIYFGNISQDWIKIKAKKIGRPTCFADFMIISTLSSFEIFSFPCRYL